MPRRANGPAARGRQRGERRRHLFALIADGLDHVEPADVEDHAPGTELPDLLGDVVEVLGQFQAVDTLVVMVPGGAGTTKLINAEVIGALGPNGVVINMSRGSLLDEDALIKALKQGEIRAAGLDVYANEPVIPDEWYFAD